LRLQPPSAQVDSGARVALSRWLGRLIFVRLTVGGIDVGRERELSAVVYVGQLTKCARACLGKRVAPQGSLI